MTPETRKFIKALFALPTPLGKVYPIFGCTLLFTFGVGGFVLFNVKTFFGNLPYILLWFYSLLLAYNLLVHTVLFFIHNKVIETREFRYSLHYSIVFSITTLIPFLLFTGIYFVSCLHMQNINLIITTHVLVGVIILGLFCYDFIKTQNQNYAIYLNQPISLDSIRFQGNTLKLISIFGKLLLAYAIFVGYKILFASRDYVDLLAASIFSIGSIILIYTVISSLYVLVKILPRVERETGRPIVLNTKIYK